MLKPLPESGAPPPSDERCFESITILMFDAYACSDLNMGSVNLKHFAFTDVNGTSGTGFTRGWSLSELHLGAADGVLWSE